MIAYTPLKRKLAEKHTSMTAMCKAVDLSPNVVGKLKKGEIITIATLSKICSYFNCQPGDIMIFKDEETA